MSQPLPDPVVVPLTPEQEYQRLKYQYPRDERFPVVRIPIAGPPPFTTLAVVHTLVAGYDVPATGQLFRIHASDLPTPLVLRGFDPADPVHRQVRHSTMVGIRHSEARPQEGLFDDSGANFHLAVDAVTAESVIDDSGRWLLTLDIAARSLRSPGSHHFIATSWVLVVERPPASASMTLEETSESSLASAAAAAAQSYRRYLATPGADLSRASDELTVLLRRLMNAGLPWETLRLERAIVELLADATVSAEQRSLQILLLAEARHNLLVRAQDVALQGLVDLAAQLAPQIVDGYTAYAASTSADLPRVLNDLHEVVKPMLATGQPGQALRAQRLRLDLLQRVTTPPGRELPHELEIAEARHDLLARLISAGLVTDATAELPAVLAAYRGYAARPGANLAQVLQDLGELDTLVLRPAGLLTEADAVHRVAQELAGG